MKFKVGDKIVINNPFENCLCIGKFTDSRILNSNEKMGLKGEEIVCFNVIKVSSKIKCPYNKCFHDKSTSCYENSKYCILVTPENLLDL